MILGAGPGCQRAAAPAPGQGEGASGAPAQAGAEAPAGGSGAQATEGATHEAAASTGDDTGAPAPGVDGSPTPREPQYHLVAKTRSGVGDGSEGAPRFRVFAADDGEVFVSHGPWLMRPDADGGLTRDPAWITGIQSPVSDPYAAELAVDWTVHTVGGRWPDGLYMSSAYISPFRGDVYDNQTYRWLGDRWHHLDTERPRYVSYPERVEAWGESVVALRGFTPRYKEAYTELGPPKSEERAIQAAIAKVKPMAVYAGPAKAPRLGESVLDFDARASGELVALAAASKAALHYDAATDAVTKRALPEAEEATLRGVVLPRADRGYVFGEIVKDEGERREPYLARFDGATWAREEAPPCAAGLVAVSYSEVAGLYAICHDDSDLGVYPAGALWRLHGGRWSAVELPEGGAVSGVVAEGPGGVWIAATRAAYGPKRPAKVLELDGFGPTATSLAEYGAPSPTPLLCEGGLEMHYALLDGALGGDHREDREALAKASAGDENVRGVMIVEVEFRGAQRLALMIEGDLEKRTIAAIQAAFGERLGDTYCFPREPTKRFE
ncbi:MAG: hypothetical protein R3A79_08155 [Nannocystaceae bacterium]